MSVDIKQLAVNRGPSRGDTQRNSIEPPRRVLSRYVLPVTLLTGFALVSAWAARDSLLPRQNVTVMPVHVSTAEVQQSGTPLFKAAGWVEPRPTPIRVAALAAGVIEKLLVVEDQAVAAGEPIAYLVADDARLTLEASRATLKLREAEVERSQAALQAAQTNFAEPTYLQAEAAAAEADLKKVETQLTALPFLIESAKAHRQFTQADLVAKQKATIAISEIQLVEAQSALDTARASVEELTNRHPSLLAERKSLTAKLAAVRRKLELKTEERRTLDEAKAQLEAAIAMQKQASVAVAEAQLRLDRMTIRAPVAGRVMHLLTTPGTFVSGSVSMGTGMSQHDSGTVVTLYQPDRLQVRVDVRFEDLPQTALGQPVQIESPALSEPIVGRVLFPTSFADIQKNTLSVKVAIDDPPELLKPEMLVDVTFLSSGSSGDANTESSDSAAEAERIAPLHIFIPRELVSSDESGATVVWLADLSAGIARRQRIEISESGNGPLVEVTSGLTPASRLIASGQMGLRDGDRILVTKTEAPPAATSPNHKHLERRPGSGT
ncbi:HlyD family efflux transporter periplasmic adaptor subunit [bacterium]|nr:HlyD family efflux transporter periplasmic adaptor subunit [bacterium]